RPRAVECLRRLRVLVERGEIRLLRLRAAVDVVLERLHVVRERDQILPRRLLHLGGVDRGGAPAPERAQDEEARAGEQDDRPPVEAVPAAVAARGPDAVDEVDERRAEAVELMSVERLRRELARLAAAEPRVGGRDGAELAPRDDGVRAAAVDLE